MSFAEYVEVVASSGHGFNRAARTLSKAASAAEGGVQVFVNRGDEDSPQALKRPPICQIHIGTPEGVP
ncbi:MAG: hypothetical protein HY313_09555 [Acidobacteria bacterium]|nr:hypothetical protein [Acidobacteriota bacterium]